MGGWPSGASEYQQYSSSRPTSRWRLAFPPNTPSCCTPSSHIRLDHMSTRDTLTTSDGRLTSPVAQPSDSPRGSHPIMREDTRCPLDTRHSISASIEEADSRDLRSRRLPFFVGLWSAEMQSGPERIGIFPGSHPCNGTSCRSYVLIPPWRVVPFPTIWHRLADGPGDLRGTANPRNNLPYDTVLP